MLNNYIKNRGITQTILHSNNENHFNQVNWDADYDGNIANISIDSNNDGKRNQYNFTLDNQDLANIFNIPSINVPIDKRLQMDFQDSFNSEPYLIELPKKYEIEEPYTNKLSSPLPNEELIIPLTIDRKTSHKYTLTPRRRHKRHKTHITHKVYKKSKSSRRKSKSSRRNSRL